MMPLTARACVAARPVTSSSLCRFLCVQARDEFFVTHKGEPLTTPMVTLVSNALQVRGLCVCGGEREREREREALGQGWEKRRALHAWARLASPGGRALRTCTHWRCCPCGAWQSSAPASLAPWWQMRSLLPCWYHVCCAQYYLSLNEMAREESY